jgi:hypothetical protein
LKLGKRASGFNGFVLSAIPDQQDSIIRMQPLDELMQLPGGSERRLVEHMESFLTRVGLLSACQMFL